MEQDDAKIAENWWSGTAGTTGAPGEEKASTPPESNDWESLRQKFVSSHETQSAVKRTPPSRVLRAIFVLLALGLVLIGGLSLLLFGSRSMLPTEIRESLGAVFTDVPANAVPAGEPAQPAAKTRKTRPVHKSGPSKRAEASKERVVNEELPFTIEVIDRNRRTVMHAYQDPLQMDLDQPLLVSRAAPEVPSLVIEERIRPDGSLRTTTNVGASVVLSGVIGTDGRMRNLAVIRGPVEFVPAAMEAVRRWRFAVAQHHGFPAERAARVTVNMAIKADGQPPDPLR